jgi:uncharacterized protein (TIGR04255 family)
MPNNRHYPHAPITEALIDFRVNYGRTISLANLKSFGTDVKREYPLESNRDLIQGQFDFKAAEPQVQSSKATVGYIFHSADRRQAVQARLDGFTVSRLPPYQNWAQLRDETKRLWSVFREALRPESITRVAVRYINQINLPFEGGNLRFEDYLHAFPKMEVDEDILLEQFFMRLVMPQKDLNAKLILTEALLPPQDRHLGVILDIDLFRENVSIDAKSMETWDILEEFRNRKNRFFESITDATRKLFA